MQNIHWYNYMLFRVCHASMKQACNKKHFEETTLVEMKVSLKNERVLSCRGVIKRMDYTIIPWNWRRVAVTVSDGFCGSSEQECRAGLNLEEIIF